MTRHECPGDDCGRCQRLIEQAEMERDYPEPMSVGEEQQRDDAYEREMDRSWG